MFCRSASLYLHKKQKQTDMAKLSQIRRLAILINKLSAVRYVPTDALVAHVENTLALYDNKDSNYSQRTMQRDFGLIDEMFGIVIRNDKSRGYYIAELDEMTDNYKELLLNFELLSSINTDSVLQKYVLAEHRQNAIRHELIAPLLKAIRKRNPIEFDYTLVRHNGKIVHKRLMPHFLKESQYRWYLIGYDTDGKLKSFGVDRISAINILEDTQFLRDEHIDIPSLFRESYGIWNNPEDPVEEIVLKYDSVDGAFVKTLPLHHSQQILSEDETGITVKLRLRITNDFVMELLSHSRSVEVVAPHTLRTRLYDTLRQAAERNKPIETECD